MRYADHNCPKSAGKDFQIPICPLCNTSLSRNRNQQPDVVVSEHIDQQCQSEKAILRRKVHHYFVLKYLEIR